jgi:exosortase/archaeosortase family protein
MRVDAIQRFPSLIVALHALCFWPVWRWYVARMTDGSDEPWGVVALVAAVLLTFPFGRNTKLRADDGLLAAAALLTLVYAAAVPFAPPLVRSALAMAALACSWVSFTGARSKLPAIAVLFALSLPVIASLQFYAGYPLRSLTTAGGATTLNLLGMDVERAGTALLWHGRTVLVDAPCSGVRMLWMGVVLGCVLALQRDSIRWRSLALLLMLVLPVTLFANSLRAAALFIIETRDQPLPEIAHTLVGIATFTVAGVAVVIVESWLRSTARSAKSTAYA